MQYNYFIIEDNVKAIESLELFLKEYPSYKSLGSSDRALDAFNLITTKKPDLIFLDVELADGSGFDVIQNLKLHFTTLPKIVMITSHDQYAKEAVNQDVFYFLSKPFDPDELTLALKKFETQFLNQLTQLSFKTSEGYEMVNISNILLVSADGNYAKIFKTNGEYIMVSKPIKEIESRLPDSFLRIHKSFIVNKNYIERLNTTHKNVVLSISDQLVRIQHIFMEKEIWDETEETAQNKPKKLVLPVGKSYLNEVKNALL